MKRFFAAVISILFLTVFSAYAEEPKKNSSFSDTGRGGMTYSPTEGWIKTGANQMQVGTDSMEFFNRKKLEEAEKKRIAEAELKKKADEDAAVKLKAEQEAKLAKAEAIIRENEAKMNKGKKKAAPTVDASGKQLPPKRRVLVS